MSVKRPACIAVALLVLASVALTAPGRANAGTCIPANSAGISATVAGALPAIPRSFRAGGFLATELPAAGGNLGAAPLVTLLAAPSILVVETRAMAGAPSVLAAGARPSSSRPAGGRSFVQVAATVGACVGAVFCLSTSFSKSSDGKRVAGMNRYAVPVVSIGAGAAAGALIGTTFEKFSR